MSDRENVDAPIDILEEDDAPEIEERTGFLPIQTNWFDRCFISVVIWVAISLFWFRFLEPLGLSIWLGNAISLAIAIYIVRKG
jgi:predicted small integral membrane protein